MSEICLVCGEDYPPNGIVMCDDCGMDKDIEQQQEREGKQVKEQLLQETAEILTMKDFSVEEIKQILDNIYEDGRASK